MRRFHITAFSLVLMGSAVAALADGRQVRAHLRGFEEAPGVSSSGHGEFRGVISGDGSQIDFELSYAELEGNVGQAHIHFGQQGTNGGIVIFLCTNMGNGPPGTQLCPPAPATISGTLTMAEVVGAPAQGIAAGELEEVLRAIRGGVAYVNVHSDLFPAGEIRGQAVVNRRRDQP